MGLFVTMKPIGILIKEELEKQERSITWFARKLSCDRSNIYRLFQKESIDIETEVDLRNLNISSNKLLHAMDYVKEKEQLHDSR